MAREKRRRSNEGRVFRVKSTEWVEVQIKEHDSSGDLVNKDISAARYTVYFRAAARGTNLCDSTSTLLLDVPMTKQSGDVSDGDTGKAGAFITFTAAAPDIDWAPVVTDADNAVSGTVTGDRETIWPGMPSAGMVLD